MKRFFVAIACLALASPAWAAKTRRVPAQRPASPLAPVTATIAGSPLTIVVGDDTSTQVTNSNVPGTGQFYPPDCGAGETADNGIFVGNGGIVYGPDFDNHPCGSAANTYNAVDPRLLFRRDRHRDRRRSVQGRHRGPRGRNGPRHDGDADVRQRRLAVEHLAGVLPGPAPVRPGGRPDVQRLTGRGPLSCRQRRRLRAAAGRLGRRPRRGLQLFTARVHDPHHRGYAADHLERHGLRHRLG